MSNLSAMFFGQCIVIYRDVEIFVIEILIFCRMDGWQTVSGHFLPCYGSQWGPTDDCPQYILFDFNRTKKPVQV